MKNNRLFFGLLLFLLVVGWLWRVNRSPEEAPLKVPSVAKAKAPAVAQSVAAQTPPSTEEINTLEADPTLTAEEKGLVMQNPGDFAKYIRFAQARFETNSTPINVYGKVIDQYGRPVADAVVKGGTLLMVSPISSGGEEFATKTDAQGRFSFTGLHGARFGLGIEKPSYQFDSKNYLGWWDGYKPDPNNPAVFTIWKLKGAEPMLHWNLDRIGLAVDGTPREYSVLLGKKVDGAGEIVLSFVRTPSSIVRGKPFDWVLTIQIPTGGLAEITSPYPNEAPVDGYKPTVTITMPASAKTWSPSFDHSYYFSARNGQIFGRMKVHLDADYEQPPTHFELEVYANPAGSRNLEFDEAKQVKP